VHNALKFGLAEEYMVYVFPGWSSGVKGRNEHVGGITMLVSKRSCSGWSVSKLYPDPSGCGIYLAADLNNADGRWVRVMGVYFPLTSSSTSTPLVRLLKSVLSKNRLWSGRSVTTLASSRKWVSPPR
jgi:hypothetical protein